MPDASAARATRAGRRLTAVLAGAALALSLTSTLQFAGPTPQAHAKKAAWTPTPTVRHELPFICGTTWTGSTRGHHSPSVHSVDFNAPSDEGKPVLASARGVVTKADNSSTAGYGRHVIIDHGNGESSVYAHLKRVFARTGATIDQGEILGELGNTGNSSGAHLHYEQKVGRTVVAPWFAGSKYAYGTGVSANCVDVPVSGTLAEPGAAQVGVFRRNSSGEFRVRRADGSTSVMRIGRGTDEPLVGDWDGDGLMDPGVWSARSKKYTLAGEAGFITLKSGARGDRPIAGDWDGDGVWEVGVRRGTQFRLRSATGAITAFTLGNVRDIPVTGDWNGDGITDVGVYDPNTSVFTLRTVLKRRIQIRTVAHGQIGDLPTVGDFDGDGKSDLGTWSPSGASFNLTQAEGGTLARPSRVKFGRARKL